MKCAKCGKPITVTIPRKVWLHSKYLHPKEFSDFLPDAVLIYLVNSGFKHNVWLCTECYNEWCKANANRIKFEDSWNLWFGGEKVKEVVQFT